LVLLGNPLLLLSLHGDGRGGGRIFEEVKEWGKRRKVEQIHYCWLGPKPNEP